MRIKILPYSIQGAPLEYWFQFQYHQNIINKHNFEQQQKKKEQDLAPRTIQESEKTDDVMGKEEEESRVSVPVVQEGRNRSSDLPLCQGGGGGVGTRR